LFSSPNVLFDKIEKTDVLEKLMSSGNDILFALANMNRHRFVALGSKYDIASSHTVAEKKSRIWHKFV